MNNTVFQRLKNSIHVVLPTMFGTVLGIVLTFGVSKLEDSARKKRMQKMVVMNVINDFDDAYEVLRSDSSLWAGELTELNRLYNYAAYTEQENLCVDSLLVVRDIFRYYYEYASANSTDVMLKSDLGILDNLDGSSIIRFINWSYDNGNAYFDKRRHVYELKQRVESKINAWCGPSGGIDEALFLKEILFMEETINYTVALQILIDYDILSQHSRLLRGSKEIILEKSGISAGEYDEFCKGLKDTYQKLNERTTELYLKEKQERAPTDLYRNAD